jgi:hypothetical protein
MNLPGFSADTSLYKTSNHYSMIANFGRASESINPVLSLKEFVEISPHYLSFGPIVAIEQNSYVTARACCRNCMNFPCADEQCRRQRLFHCTSKCKADVIGGCGCPTGRAVCEGVCCRPGEVCTLDGCTDPAYACMNRRCGPGERCTPAGCCALGNAFCKDRCCPSGWTCSSEGCCPPGVCCESTPCSPGKFCCGGEVCCQNGAECRVVHGTSQYGCFN